LRSNGTSKKSETMKIKSLFAILVVLSLTALSAAQDGAKSALQGSVVDGFGLPGQGWTSVGNQSPIEHNNFYTQSYFEQSAAVFSTYSGSITVTPFIGVGLVLDTKGYEWNNKIQPRLRIFLRRSLQELQQQRAYAFRAGLVRLAAGRRSIEPFSRIFVD